MTEGIIILIAVILNSIGLVYLSSWLHRVERQVWRLRMLHPEDHGSWS